MPDKLRDPLDDLDDLLADDEPTDSGPLPEPSPTVIEDAPEPESFVWEGDEVEPPPSELAILDEDTIPELEVSDEEPPGDDLHWAETEGKASDEGQWPALDEESALLDGPAEELDGPAEELDGPAEELDWPAEEEAPILDEDWADLEESSRLLPAGRLLVGLEERAALPELELSGISVIMDTGRTGSVLGGGAGAPIHTTVRLGTVVLHLLLERVDGPAVLRLGQDAISGRFVVDPEQRMVLSRAE